MSDSDDDEGVSKKRKLQLTSTSSQKKLAKVIGIDEQAELSGDDNGSESEEEDESNYVEDDFLVGDSKDDAPEDDLFSAYAPKTKLKKLQKNTNAVQLDEDDELLIQESLVENIASRDKADSEDEDEDEAIAPMMVHEEPMSEGGKSTQRRTVFDRDDEDGSEMGDFIVPEDDDGDDEEEEQDHLQQKYIAPRRSGKRDGPTYDQMQEAMDIFGAGFDDFDEEEEELDEEEDVDVERPDGDDDAPLRSDADNATTVVTNKLSAKDRRMINKLRSRYERSQLVASFCTDRDEEIRRVDRPERFLDVMKGREAPDDHERAVEAQWMATKLAKHIAKQSRSTSRRADDGLAEELIEAVTFVLKSFQVDQLEVPFIWTYRRDYLHPSMTREHLWLLFSLDEQWEALFVMKTRLMQLIQALGDSAEGSAEKDELLRKKVDADVKNFALHYNSLLTEVMDAEQHEKECMDKIDENEDHSLEDRENVTQATERLETLRAQLAPAHQDLHEAKREAEIVNDRILRKASYAPVVAKEVMRLFPKQRFLDIVEDTSDEEVLRDIFRYLTTLLRGLREEPLARGTHGDPFSGESASSEHLEEADGENDSVDEDASKAPRVAKSANRNRSIAKKDEYSKFKALIGLRKFAEMISVPVSEFGDGFRHGFKVEPPTNYGMVCHEVAAKFVDSKLLKTEQAVIKAASVLIATELSVEPNVRKSARDFFREKSSLSTRPTEKGLASISPFSENFGIHYLDCKPLSDMYVGADRTLFVRLVEAEKLGLITVSINPPGKRGEDGVVVPDLGPLFLNLMPLFLPSQQDSANASWDEVRLAILQQCLERYLLPSLQEELRRDLLRIGREAIVEEASVNFEKMLRVGPYRTPNPDSREYIKDLLRSCPNRPTYATVCAIYQSTSGTEPLFMAFVNKDGVVRAHDLLPTEAASQKMDRIKQFILSNRPDLIVLNSSAGFASRSLSMHIEKNLLREVGETLQRQHNDLAAERERSGVRHEDDDEEYVPYKAQVMIVKDELASIFKISTRAKTMFPELQPGGAAAVSLARFVQEPLAEYCNIWTAASATEVFGFEALFLDLHPLKNALGGSKLLLLKALERKLVDAVCDVGVDVNKAATMDHLHAMLAFVCGLGLRKADALRQNIRRLVGTVESRNALLVKKLLGKNVWTNAVGFLRIGDIGQDRTADLLDNTRIHPECYVTHDFAPKICADALEVDNNPQEYPDIVERLMKSVRRELEKRMKKHPKWVDLWEKGERLVQGVTVFTDKIKTLDGIEHPLSIELHDSLSQLLLDEFAVDLEMQGKGKRRMQLDHIKEELRFPWLDLRPSVQQISAEDMFATLTGESDSTLFVGLKVGCTVTEISDASFFDERTHTHKRRQRAMVKTDTGLRGFISIYDVTDERIDLENSNLSDYLQTGAHILAVVIGVKKDKLLVDLSIKPSHLSSSEAWWMEQRNSEKYAREWWENVMHRNPSTIFDRCFNEREALRKFVSAEEAMTKKAEGVNMQLNAVSLGGRGGSSSFNVPSSGLNRTMMRLVHHPLFVNLDYKATEDKLRMEGKGAGEVLIRPSSKGADYLTITWAFQENWFKHISVQEMGKRAGDLGLGSELLVMEPDMQEPFSDLDEIFSRYIEPMNDLVAVMVQHRNFLAGSVEEVEAQMKQQLVERPERIPYFIRFEPTRPGAFVLTWLSLNTRSEVPVKKELIEVRPYGYKIRSETFARPSDLITWFKKTTEAAAQHNRLQVSKQPVAVVAARPIAAGGYGSGIAAQQQQSRPTRFGQIDRSAVSAPQVYMPQQQQQQQQPYFNHSVAAPISSDYNNPAALSNQQPPYGQQQFRNSYNI